MPTFAGELGLTSPQARQNMTVKPKRKGLTLEIDREAFAMELKTWRISQGLTQRELAKRWQLSRYTLLRVEKAQAVSWMTAYRLWSKLSEEYRNQ